MTDIYLLVERNGTYHRLQAHSKKEAYKEVHQIIQSNAAEDGTSPVSLRQETLYCIPADDLITLITNNRPTTLESLGVFRDEIDHYEVRS